MEVKRTAEEDRRIKLQEYLAAKGKLKPQNSTKPYLKDCTNRQNLSKSQPSKPALICKQSENVHSKGKSALQANRLMASKPLPSQEKSKSVPPKLPTRRMLPVSTKPSTILASRNINLSRQCKKGSDKVATVSKIQTAVENALREAPTCTLDGEGEEVKGNTVHVESQIQGLFSSVQRENAASSHLNVTCVIKKTQTNSKASKANIKNSNTIQPAPGGLTSKSMTNRAQNPKMQKALPHASKTQRPAGKPATPVRAGQTSNFSRANQPALSQSRINPVRPWLVKTSRTETSRPREPLGAGVPHSRNASLKQNTVKKLGTYTQTTAVVYKKVVSSTLTTNKQKDITKPAPRLQSMGHVSNKPMDKQSSTLSYKQNLRPQSTGSAVTTKPAPRQRARSDVTSIKPRSIQKQEVAVTSYKRNRPVSNLTSSKSDMGTINTTSKLHATPRTAAEDRKKRLEEWLNSKGKSYKRPPMTLPPKSAKRKKPKSLNCSLWEGLEDEDELLSLSKKINKALSECLELIEQGVPSESVHAVLTTIPEAQKFAKFWVCKARLLEKEGIFDVIDLYEQAVKLGVTPIEELREVIFDVMKNTGKKTKAVTFGPLPKEDTSQESQQGDHNEAESPTRPPRKNSNDVVMPNLDPTCQGQGSTLKFQVGCLSSKKSEASGQDWKVLTPVRRSLRIKRSITCYPEILREHDTVVASLGELLDMADTDCFVYWKNEALPEEADNDILDMITQDTSEEQVGKIS
ncbi:cytoskeleton-associated protein 2-like [Discoglossus pictus]